MHFGLTVTCIGEFADPRNVARLAQYAEAAGWDGLFYWDHVAFVRGVPCGDPWVTLSAVATVTNRIKIGSAVTPVPRRRPHVVAHTLMALDLLSGGRVIFGAGLGGRPAEFSAFGEPDDLRTRAVQLDEGLDVIRGLLNGERVEHHGTYYTVDGVTLSPLPVQSHLPIWIGGGSRAALRRAARWDGWMASSVTEGKVVMTPEGLAADVAYLREQRTADEPFEVTVAGYSTPGDSALVREYAAAGATWWLESIGGTHGAIGTLEEITARVAAGPPDC